MTAFLLTLNALICAALILIILLQRTDPSAGGMFGGTGGGSGPAVRNPLAGPTAWLAGAFLLISLVVAYGTKGGGTHHSVVGGDLGAATEQAEENSTTLLPVDMSDAEVPTEPAPTTPEKTQ